MARGNTGLDSTEYDSFLAERGRQRELRERQHERKNANKGFKGWHFGLGDTPVHTKDKAEFKRELDKRGLVMKDEVSRRLK